MPIILKNFSNDDSFSGIWKMSETKEELLQLYTPNNYDAEILNKISSDKRCCEILAVRALIKQLGLDLNISYNDRKPISSKGFISISHSFNYACVIWHPTKKVTIDIEKISTRILKIAQRAFSEKELAFTNKDETLLTILWNCKECIFKINNTPDIEFRTQINVLPFDLNEDIIYCNYVDNNEVITNYKLNKLSVEGFSCVWGML